LYVHRLRHHRHQHCRNDRQPDVHEKVQVQRPRQVLHRQAGEQRTEAEAADVGAGGDVGGTAPPVLRCHFDQGDRGRAGEDARGHTGEQPPDQQLPHTAGGEEEHPAEHGEPQPGGEHRTAPQGVRPTADREQRGEYPDGVHRVDHGQQHHREAELGLVQRVHRRRQGGAKHGHGEGEDQGGEGGAATHRQFLLVRDNGPLPLLITHRP
jgi:hypothetical protein